jgi:transcriptional regulator with XRE-family HTH domain
LSSDRVAILSGLTGGYLRDLEKDRRTPSNDVVRRIAQAIGVPAAPLLEAAMSGRASVVLDASATLKRREVAHRLAIAWDLMTDEALERVMDALGDRT